MKKTASYSIVVEFKSITPEIILNNLHEITQVVFEVTSACNFRCEYCSYGKLYVQNNRQPYKKEFLSFENAKILLDFLVSAWSKHMPATPDQNVYISFFGGEPLLNMKLISSIIDYVEKIGPINRKFVFSMTTNGWLLNRYQKYLVEKDVRLLISLDGNEIGNSYRLSVSGQQTHSKIMRNIISLREKYPQYFDKRVNFNAVLHNKNSLSGVTEYFKETFGKIPQVSPLASSNVNPEYLEKFRDLSRQAEDIKKLDETKIKTLLKDQYFNIPIIHEIVRDYFLNSGNVFRSYNELVFGQNLNKFQTGTCTPFSKKIFLRANCEILACERIPEQFSLGRIEHGRVVLDVEGIANKYNSWLGLLTKQCHICARNHICNQCIFQIDEFPDNVACEGFLTHNEYEAMRKRLFSILGKYPELYKQIFEEVILS